VSRAWTSFLGSAKTGIGLSFDRYPRSQTSQYAVAEIFVSSVPQFRKSRIELECLRLTNCDLMEIFVERIQDEIAL
jgi:hypothetical protein